MAIGAYLQTAAAQLRRAAQERKREADEARAAIQQKEIQLNKFKSDLERHMGYKRGEARSAEDSQEKMRKAREIQELQKAKTDAEQQLNQEKQNHANTISAKESDMQELLQKAAELEKRPAD